MPQYGVIVYAQAPANPMALTPEYLEALGGYPDLAKELGGKVLGGKYFPEQRGFAFDASTAATAIRDDNVSSGPLVESDLVPAAFFVVSAPDMDAAVRVAAQHPAARDGGIEVRPLYVPPAE
ncbi:MAG: hypothetical protein WBJ62_01580 [Coriobacteriia bacterium]|jgi:hypothetical protein